MKEQPNYIYHIPFRDSLAGFGLLPKVNQQQQKRIYLVDNQIHFEQPGIHSHEFTSIKTGKETHQVIVSDNEIDLGEEGSGNREVEFLINRTSGKIEVQKISPDLEANLESLHHGCAIHFAHLLLLRSNFHEKEYIATGSPSQIAKQLQSHIAKIRKKHKCIENRNTPKELLV
jgi:hypothetical protein